jgi:hypothetical protein
MKNLSVPGGMKIRNYTRERKDATAHAKTQGQKKQATMISSTAYLIHFTNYSHDIMPPWTFSTN